MMCGEPGSGWLTIQRTPMSPELGPVLEMIENALRADQAKMIEAEAEWGRPEEL
jgi:hypothetical protein